LQGSVVDHPLPAAPVTHQDPGGQARDFSRTGPRRNRWSRICGLESLLTQLPQAGAGLNHPKTAAAGIGDPQFLQHGLQAQELGLNFEKLAVEDRKSARDMQATTRSMMPPILAGAVTVGFFGIMVMMFFNKIDSANPAILMMLGSLGTAWTGIIAYYFGSSAGSQAKTDLLSKAAK